MLPNPKTPNTVRKIENENPNKAPKTNVASITGIEYLTVQWFVECLMRTLLSASSEKSEAFGN